MKPAIRRRTGAKSSFISRPNKSVANMRISYRTARQIADQAALHYPKEVCGLLAGSGKRIMKAFPVSNIADKPETQYQLQPDEQLKALKQIDADRLTWIGIYHSHPKSRPIPSPADIQQASDDGLLHLIVSLRHSEPKLKLWRIQTAAVTPIELIFDTESSLDDSNEPLSDKQKIAVILAGALSLALMLVISLTLLPPAPVILP